MGEREIRERTTGKYQKEQRFEELEVGWNYESRGASWARISRGEVYSDNHPEFYYLYIYITKYLYMKMKFGCKCFRVVREVSKLFRAWFAAIRYNDDKFQLSGQLAKWVVGDGDV